MAEIPTLSKLYKNKVLKPAIGPDFPAPSQRYNDTLCTLQHDITKLEVDAIVNAANRSLLGGGGVDGAIHRAAGPELFEECSTLGGCDTGSAKITNAYNLPCKRVIHAVGPTFSSVEESEPLLRSCYKTALELAAKNECKSIAFSALSTGIYGYPPNDAAEAVLREVRGFLSHNPLSKQISKIIFCSFADQDVRAYSLHLP